MSDVSDKSARLAFIAAKRDAPLADLSDEDLLLLCCNLALESHAAAVGDALVALLQRDAGAVRSLAAAHGLAGQLIQAAISHPDRGLVGRVCRLLEILDPAFSRVVDGEPEEGGPGQRSSRIAFDYAAVPLRGFHADVFVRRYFFGPGSRLHDVGWRIASGLANGGWSTRLADPTYDRNWRTLVADMLPRRHRAIAIVDLTGLFIDEPRKAERFLARVRSSYRWVICLVLDPWVAEFDTLLKPFLGQVDLVWSQSPHAYIDAMPEIAGRSCLIPFPVGLRPTSPTRRMALATAGGMDDARISFVGSIESFNRDRVYWWLAAQEYPDRIVFDRTSAAADDGLGIEASLEAYLTRLVRTQACLNLTRRSTGVRVTTERSFDVPALNRLLVQEACREMHCYMTPGEEFVEVNSFPALLATSEDLRADPAKYQRIRAAGHARHQACFSDQAVVRHLSALLA